MTTITVHDNFEPKEMDRIIGEPEVSRKIRTFSKWVAENLPDHVACFNLTVTRKQYVTQAISKDE